MNDAWADARSAGGRTAGWVGAHHTSESATGAELGKLEARTLGITSLTASRTAITVSRSRYYGAQDSVPQLGSLPDPCISTDLMKFTRITGKEKLFNESFVIHTPCP
ncbi:hypothetical protein AMAG_20571 [Allomyces macrogynus ATCC 38327]|uniref:Uncharacterized protein n=1 Tax=Allomyces macrogynus (strain ATCC 38327) TaxID=578462 RepID=A0A0L0TCB5_ALLM3|nr:hypothetical protein AMAG_20571 [Allomyces macrogynus ATCC 38327]|eukprot:KNE72387.1 hypothetical protein AMAG_20571 [Allomyces macrogynus ATCC 38327]